MGACWLVMFSDWRVLSSTKCRCGFAVLARCDAHPVQKIKHHLVALTVRSVHWGMNFLIVSSLLLSLQSTYTEVFRT